MTTAQRRATKRYRERRRKSGLRRVEVQVSKRDAPVIRKAAAVLRDRPQEAAQLRAHLGFEKNTPRSLSALDVFARREQLSEEGEALWDEAMAQVERDRKDPVLGRLRDVEL